MKYDLPRAPGERRNACGNTKRSRDGAEHAIDRHAFLRAAGQVDAPKQQTPIELGRAEYALQQAVDDRPKHRHLPWKREHGATAVGIPLSLETSRHTLLQSFDERVELATERFSRTAGLRQREGERRAPHLRASRLAEIVERTL